MTDLTDQIADYIAKVEYHSFSPAVIAKAKLALRDWSGVTLAGSKEPLANILLGFANFLGGNERATVLGRPFRCNGALAALRNGASPQIKNLLTTNPRNNKIPATAQMRY